MGKLYYALSTPLSFEEAEKRILESEGVCRFRDYTHDPALSLEQFVQRFFNLSENLCTERVDGGLETNSNRNRSLVDIFRTCKYYYPDCTLRDVVAGMQKIDDLVSIYCADVHREVFRRTSGYVPQYMTHLYYPTTDLNEFGYHGIKKMYEALNK